MNSLLTHIPPKPGVYIFRDSSGQPLYIGKAINLKNRVGSYFLSTAKKARFSSEARGSYFKRGLDLGPKTTLMVSKIEKIEHIVVESEIEALLLESDLIKRLKPKYNVQLKDDKAYQYIRISNDKDYPKISTTRKNEGVGIYFGPFPEGKTVNQVLRALRRIFPFRDCSFRKFKRYQKLSRPCLYGDLKLCPAPCVGRISPEDYKKIISQLKRFLSGKSKLVIRELEKEMKVYSKAKEFEKAALVRDRIRNYEYVTQGFRQASEYLEHPDLLEDQRQKELEELKKVVGIEKLERIEAYDISNISGKHATGSMAVFVNGEPSKRDYRRFKIKTITQADDVGMIKEVLRRRFKKSWSFPALILVDGGKPQVGAVNEVLKEYGLEIPVLGLAKKFEEIIKNDLSVIRLSKDSPALHLLQRIRDEAHRFALSYHRTLRSKSMKK